MAAKVGSSLLESIKVLFYSSSILGIIPYSLRDFYSRTVLRVSVVGNIWVLLSVVSYSVSYHMVTDAYVGVGGGGQGRLDCGNRFLIKVYFLLSSQELVQKLVFQWVLREMFVELTLGRNL